MRSFGPVLRLTVLPTTPLPCVSGLLPLQVALTQVWLRLWAPVWSFHSLELPSPSTKFFHVDTIFAAKPVPITLLNAAALPLSGFPSPGPVLWSSHAHTI